MPIAPNSILTFTWKTRVFGEKVRHVRNWRLQSGGGGGNEVQHADAFIASVKVGGPADWTTSLLACLSIDCVLTGYQAQIVKPVRGAYGYLDVPVGGPTGSRGIAITGNITASIQASTVLAGRSQIACYKLGTLATDDCQFGKVRAALVQNLMAYSATFKMPVTLFGLVPSVWVPCIYHAKPKPGQPNFNDIYDSGYRDEVRVKNTRTIGRGM